MRRLPRLPDHDLLILPHSVIWAGNAHSRHHLAVHIIDRRRHADQPRFNLTVIHGISVEPGLDQLGTQLVGIGDGVAGQRISLAVHPLAVIVDV